MSETLTLKDIGDFLKKLYNKPEVIYVTSEELDTLINEIKNDTHQSADPRMFAFAWNFNGYPLALWYEIQAQCKTVYLKVVS